MNLLLLVSMPMMSDIYSNLETQVNALTTTSAFQNVVSVDKQVTEAAAADLITPEQFESLDVKIRNIYRTSNKFEHLEYGNMPNDANHRIRQGDCVLVWKNQSSSCDGSIEIKEGCTVVFITYDDTKSYGIKRSGSLWNSPLIKVSGTLIIKGAPNAPFCIDGGSVISSNSYNNGVELSQCTMASDPSERLIVVQPNNANSIPGLRATNAIIQNNYSKQQGTGLHVLGNTDNKNVKTISLYNTEFINLWSNVESDGPSVGGAIYSTMAVYNTTTLSDNSTFKGMLVNQCHFKGNSNSNAIRHGEEARLQCGGGAFAVQGGEMDLRMRNSLLESNYSPWHGGAIFWNLSTDGKLDLEGTTFERNCGGLGAAVYVQGNLTLKDCSFKENHAVIQNKDKPNYVHPAYQTGNGYDGCGGALYLQPSNAGNQDASCSLILENCMFDGNQADLDGGAILIYAVYNTSEPAKKDVHLNLDIKGNTIIKNNKSGRLGGGVALTISNELFEHLQEYNIDASVKMRGGEMSNNEVLGTFTNDRATFQGSGFGGALFVDESPLLISDGFKVLSNKSKKDGGAFYVGHGDIEIIDAEINDNNALEGNGGAMYVNGGNVLMSGGIISGNQASGNGGALYVNGDLNYNSGQIINNTASNNGGGVYVNGGNVNFSDGVLKENEGLNGGGIYLGSGASMTFTNGLIAKNNAFKNTNDITTAYNAKSAVTNVNGCGGGIYLQSGSNSSQKTALIINVTNSFGLYGNTAGRAGDDIVAEGVNTSVTVPNVSAMDLKDFDGKDAQPNWYEDYVYIEGGIDSGYADNGILKYSGGSGKRYRQMLMDGSGDLYNHLVTFSENSRTFPTTAGNDGYVCLSLGYVVLSAIIQVTGLNEKESMYFTLEQLVKPTGTTEWTVKNTYPVLVIGTEGGTVQRIVRNLIPGQYRVKQFQAGDTPWAWAYAVTSPEGGKIEKLVTEENGVNNLFPFTVQHITGENNVLHDEEYKVNKMPGNQ